MKTTPVTLPTVADPTDSIPGFVNVIPVGRVAPAELTPKAPPRATPAGNVVARLNVEPLPTANDGGLTTQAADAGGGDSAGGGGAGASAADGSCSLTSQPRSNSAPAPNPKRKTVRRPTCFMHSLFYSGTFVCIFLAARNRLPFAALHLTP